MVTTQVRAVPPVDHRDERVEYEAPKLTEHRRWDRLTASIGSGLPQQRV